MIRVSFRPQIKFAAKPPFVRIASAMGFYFALSVFLSAQFPKPIISLDAMGNPFSQHALRTAEKFAPRFENSGLAKNFLSNVRELSKPQAQAFRTSGVAHLLAISGGQVSFLAPLVSGFLVKPFVLLGAWHFSPLFLMKMASGVRAATELLTSFFCAASFGATGSLLRVVTQKIALSQTFLQRLSLAIFPGDVLLSHASLARVIFLALLVPFLGNPLQDLSFLFSALGAGFLALAAKRVGQVMRPSKGSRALTSKALQALAITTVTSGGMAILLMPISATDPLSSVCANMLAIPLVSAWICPVSLAILLAPWEAVQLFLVPVLDFGLSILNACASAFAGDATGNALSFFAAKRYLLFCLVLLWAVEDFSSRKKAL